MELMVVGEGVEGEKAVDGRKKGVGSQGSGRNDEESEENEEKRKNQVREGKLRDGWGRWLDSRWYGSVIVDRLFGQDWRPPDLTGVTSGVVI
jgi:hypothetical protein